MDIHTHTTHILYFYTGAMTHDLAVDQHSLWIDQCSTYHTETTLQPVTTLQPRMLHTLPYTAFA